MKKRISAMITCLLLCVLCGTCVMAAPADNREVYVLKSDGGSGIKTEKTDINVDLVEEPTCSLSEEPMPMNQIGEPMDQMFFYYMELYPIILKDGELKVLEKNGPYLSMVKDARAWYSAYFTPEQTQKAYQKVVDDGYLMAGWRTKVKFRFDFINPVSWTRSMNGGEALEEAVPSPHNAYQTYVMNYDMVFMTNPAEAYSILWNGNVSYRDKYDNNMLKKRPYSVVAYLNSYAN